MMDVGTLIWRPIGSGKIDDEELRGLVREIINVEVGMTGTNIILPRLPTQAEINTFPVNSVVLVYDPNNPFVPSN